MNIRSQTALLLSALAAATAAHAQPDLCAFGFGHTPLGNAGVKINADGAVSITNLGSSGQDGVVINLDVGDTPGGIDSFTMQIDALPADAEPQDAYMYFEPVGTIPGESARIEAQRTADGWLWTPSLPGNNMPQLDVVFLDEDGMTLHTLEDFLGPIGELEVIEIKELVIKATVNEASIEFGQPSSFILPDGTKILLKKVRITPASELPIAGGFATATLGGIAMEEIVIAHEAIELFDQDIPATGLADAKLNLKGPCPDCALTVSNIGASGDDGVEFKTEQARQITITQDLGPVPPGGPDGLQSIWLDIGFPNGSVLEKAMGTTLGLRSDGDLVQSVVDWSKLGSSDVVKLYKEGQLIAQVNTPSIFTSRAPVAQTFAESGPTGPFHPYVQIVFALPEPIFDDQLNFLAEADEVVFELQQPDLDFDTIEKASVTAANVESITVEDIEVDQSAPCPPDCNQDGLLNVLDFICFQALFAAGDLAADVNGDNALNILDFIAFQQAFQAGCA